MALRTQLQRHTAAAHASIERYLAFDASSWPLERYREYLRCMHAFHRDVEAALVANACVRAARLEPESRRKEGWLARDLAWFALRPIDEGPALNALASSGARALGWSYVMEGATLGGRVLYKAVEARWSLRHGAGATYLSGYGDRTSRMWAHFTSALDAVPLDAAASGAAVDGANEAFAALEEWFRRNAWHG